MTLSTHFQQRARTGRAVIGHELAGVAADRCDGTFNNGHELVRAQAQVGSVGIIGDGGHGNTATRDVRGCGIACGWRSALCIGAVTMARRVARYESFAWFK